MVGGEVKVFCHVYGFLRLGVAILNNTIMYFGEDRHNDAARMVTSTGVIMKGLMRRVEGDRPQHLNDQFSLPSR